MKAKTISKVLRAKFDDFTKSITDEQVKKLVKAHSIITGGAIASMLLGEKVNDFDIYFTNKETVLAVAKYYRDKFVETVSDDYSIQVIDHDLTNPSSGRVQLHVASRGVASSEDVDAATEYCDPEADKAKELAGVDIKDGTEAAAEDKEDSKYRPVYLSDNAITLSHKVQLILRFYGSAEEIHENYDFVHATNYWTSADGQLTLNKAALQALLARTLVYRGSKYPVASVLRAKKFIQRGWNINAGQYLKMLFQVSELDLKNLEVLRDQLTGVDMMYMMAAISAIEKTLKEKPETVLDSSYFVSVIDRIFDT